MKQMVCCILLFFSLLILKVDASHYAGSTLTAGYAGTGNDYYIKFVFYRDCQGITPASDIAVYLELNGIPLDTVILPLISNVNCIAGMCGPFTTLCSGSGFEKYTYINTVNLLPGEYRIWSSECCVNGAISTGLPVLPSHVQLYLKVDSMLNDRLPDFTSDPAFFYCINQLNIYDSYSVDADGDSLVYSLIPVTLFDSASLTVQLFPYAIGIDSINFTPMSVPPVFNTITGMLSFIPNTQYYSMVAIKADSYRNGVWIGSSMRETVTFSVTSTLTNDLRKAPVRIYPTITTSEILVTGIENFTYSIYDTHSRLVVSNEFSSHIVNIQDLENGIYFIRINDEMRSYVFRFLKCQ